MKTYFVLVTVLAIGLSGCGRDPFDVPASCTSHVVKFHGNCGRTGAYCVTTYNGQLYLNREPVAKASCEYQLITGD